MAQSAFQQTASANTHFVCRLTDSHPAPPPSTTHHSPLSLSLLKLYTGCRAGIKQTGDAGGLVARINEDHEERTANHQGARDILAQRGTRLMQLKQEHTG